MNKLVVLMMGCLLACCFVSCNPSGNDIDPPPPTPKPDTLTAGWSIATPISQPITDVFFTNATNGFFISGTNIFKSSDGGSNWSKVHTTTHGLINMSMANDNLAYFAGQGSKILITRNGGASFDSVTIAEPLISDVFHINNTVAYAIGNSIWKTTDVGLTWTNLFTFSNNSYSLYFLNESTGWVIGLFGLMKTTNAGISWQPVSLNNSGAGLQLYSIFFVDASQGYIASGINTIKTTNAGTTWTLAGSFENETYHDIHFVSSTTGYATDGRFILKTTDAGTTWQKVVRLGEDNFIELHFIDATHGWACSTSGRIVKLQ